MMKQPNNRTPNRKSQSFLSGVLLLSLSAMMVKVTGLVTKIPLLHLLGSEGMGYYNAAYEIYAFLFVLSSAGLPVALSILISRGRGDRRRILRVAQRLFLLLGAVGGGGLWCFADVLAAAIGNAGAGESMRAVAPAVLFICLACAVRGYYQGMQDMSPTALSQLLEALGKLVFGLFFAALARRAGEPLTHVAAAGAWGLSAGTLLALIYLVSRLRLDQARERRENTDGLRYTPTAKRPSGSILKPLLAIAVPITLSSGVITLTRLLDMVLILRRLGMCGYSETAVSALYGTYSTLAIPLYSLLPTLVGSVALPLVPGISRAREMGDGAGERDVVSTSFRLTILLGLPASFGLAAFSRPILTLLFGGGATAEAVAEAIPLLSILGASVLSACLMTVTGAMLQAYGRPHIPLFSTLVGSAVKLASAWVLLGIPRVGMAGAPISTFLCNFTVVLINLTLLCRLLPSRLRLSAFCLRTLVASLLSVGAATSLWQFLSAHCPLPRPAVMAAVAFCVLCYLFLILRMGALRREDVVRLSHGDRLWTILSRIKWAPGGENIVKCAENEDKFFKTS